MTKRSTLHSFSWKHGSEEWEALYQPDCLEAFAKENECEIEDITYLPTNWKELEWWSVIEHPCLIGEDLTMALDIEQQVGYVIFDMHCQHIRWSGRDIVKFIKQQANNPDPDSDVGPLTECLQG